MREYQICSRCVMDTSDSKIDFDEQGVCDHCRTFDTDIKPYWHNNPKAHEGDLEALVKRIKSDGKKRDFDCIIGMSGGIDSSYLVYLAKEKLGLNPLVFHVDAGWNSKQAVSNIENITERLGLDLFTEVINWNEMRDLQLAFFKSGVPHIDAPQDHAFFSTMYKFARKHKIKYVLTGGNYSTECIRNPLEWMYYQSDDWQLRDIHKRFGTEKLESFPVTNILWQKIFLPYFSGIKVVRPLDLMYYNKEEATDELVKNLNYERYPQKHFESRFTRFYEGYWLPQRFGYDTRRVQYSSLILTGQMSRDEALKNLARPSFDPDLVDEDLQYIANKLEISLEELNQYFAMSKADYSNFRNQMPIYRFGAQIMRLLGRERGGKR